MGGRGSNSQLPSAAQPVPQPVPQPAPQQPPTPKKPTLEDIVGPQGTAKTLDEAMSLANPNYWSSVSKGDRKYTDNCQRCVWAVELLRRGYDVEAKPWNQTDRALGYGSPNSSYPKSFSNVSTRPLDFSHTIGSLTRPALAKDITDNILKHHPEGSRGALGMWGFRVGHVLNWEIKNGKVELYDGQTGERETISSLKNHGFRVFAAARMDNKDINADLVGDFVEKVQVLTVKKGS